MDTKTVQLCASRASTYIVAMPNKRTKLHMYKESLDLLTAHLSRTSESGLVTDLTPAQQTALYHAFCRVAAHISSPRHLSYIMATFDFSPHELGEEGILPQDPEPNAQASTSRSPPHHPRPDLEPPPAKKSKPTHPLAPDEMPAQYLSKTYNDHMTDYLNAPTALNLSKLNKRILTRLSFPLLFLHVRTRSHLSSPPLLAVLLQSSAPSTSCSRPTMGRTW